LTTALTQLSLYGAVSMLFFGAIYFMVPRLTGRPWASAALTSGHMVAVMIGIVGSVVALAAASVVQGDLLLDAKVGFAEIFMRVRLPLLLNTAAQFTLLSASLLVLVNFCRTALVCEGEKAATDVFRRPIGAEATVS
jgi:cytochrome c oxidase cbb3-type subunit 1